MGATSACKSVRRGSSFPLRILISGLPFQMYKHIEHFFPRLIDILCDQADDVLELDILLITDICGQKQQDVDIGAFNLKKEVNEKVTTELYPVLLTKYNKILVTKCPTIFN